MPLPMIGKNQQLVTDEPIEFEKQPVEVQDCRKNSEHFREIYSICPNLIKKKPKDVNMQLVGLANLRISTNYAQKSPRSLASAYMLYSHQANFPPCML